MSMKDELRKLQRQTEQLKDITRWIIETRKKNRIKQAAGKKLVKSKVKLPAKRYVKTKGGK